MTIKSHFNRSTTTKTVSRVPVSFEISLWKSRLKETRLHFFFRGWLFHFDCFKKKNTHTRYIIFHRTYDGDISWQLRVLSERRAVAYESCRCAPSDFAFSRASRVQSKQGSGISHRVRDTATTMLHHMGHRGESAPLRGTSRRIHTITNKVNCVICNYHRMID